MARSGGPLLLFLIMLWGGRYDAFVSYSHSDEPVVKPLVQMLSLNERRVFWDRDLQPGDEWGDVIRKNIRRSRVFVLFWCCDTSSSEYVAKEIAAAVRARKRIVPVRLCRAALPQQLSDRQWIDLRDRVQHSCGERSHDPVDLKLDAPRSRPSATRFAWVACASAVLVLLGLYAVWLQDRPRLDKTARSPTNVVAEAPAGNPNTGIHVREGYAVVLPPIDRHPGEIRVYASGKMKAAHTFGEPPQPPPDVLHEEPLPFWYTNRNGILAVAAIVAGVLFLVELSIRAQRRARETIRLTIEYLGNVDQRAV